MLEKDDIIKYLIRKRGYHEEKLFGFIVSTIKNKKG